jgi:hypothetical protein
MLKRKAFQHRQLILSLRPKIPRRRLPRLTGELGGEPKIRNVSANTSAGIANRRQRMSRNVRQSL